MDTINTKEVNIDEVLLNNYMPYAKGTIIARAIPAIDGLKPSNRRILYTMYLMNLLNVDMKKSSRIAGQTMTYHPHGDASIYDTLVRMTQGNESLNVPYVLGKGNFGKAWSKNTIPAAARYTEAKLAPICNELFEGLNENAVDMVDNFDNTEKEPVILPVKFPSILVNTSNGIAVGYSSSIASFGLKETCKATIGLLDGTIDSIESLIDIIGAPEFPTGGKIHPEQSELLKLMKYGRGTFIVSGKAELYKDRIIIKEIPYKATVESIVDDIRQYMKTELKEVTSAKDLSDIKGLNIQIMLKRGSNPLEVYKKINRLTKLRTQMSFSNTVIINGRCRTLGVYDILQEWIKFRIETIRRIYNFRVVKKSDQVHILETWEKIKLDLKGVADIITQNTEDKATELLISKYGLDEKQCEYLLDMKVRSLTQNRLDAKLKELEKTRVDLKEFREIVEDDDLKKKVIVNELNEIIRKYGKDRKCLIDEALPKNIDEIEDNERENNKKVDDSVVTIVITRKGNIKRLITLKDLSNYEDNPNDPTRFRIIARNNEKLLIFSYSGVCYKIPICDIDCSKGYAKENIYSLIDKVDDSDILTVKVSGDYKESFNIIYNDGKGVKISLSRVSGNRSKYINLYDASTPGNMWTTNEEQFFIITRRKKAAYMDTLFTFSKSGKRAFKIARIDDNDSIYGIQPKSRIPNFEDIDLSIYSKGYTVKIKHTLW